MMRRDMDSRREEARAADAGARRAESDLAEAAAGLGAFDGLDAMVSDAELRLAAAQRPMPPRMQSLQAGGGAA